jgi:hypothetical protein
VEVLYNNVNDIYTLCRETFLKKCDDFRFGLEFIANKYSCKPPHTKCNRNPTSHFGGDETCGQAVMGKQNLLIMRPFYPLTRNK